MVEHARAHRSVVRLKSGDPLIFGRAAEEIAALAEAGCPFEIVPALPPPSPPLPPFGCSLTSRNNASNVIFSTGHHAQSHNQSPLPQLEDATRVVYMPGRDLRLLAMNGSSKASRRTSPAPSSPAPLNPVSRSMHHARRPRRCHRPPSPPACSSPGGRFSRPLALALLVRLNLIPSIKW
jgi:hypothetical protein